MSKKDDGGAGPMSRVIRDTEGCEHLPGKLGSWILVATCAILMITCYPLRVLSRRKSKLSR